MSNLFYRDESYNIRGALFAVHNELGCGYLERVYQDALEVEFRLRNIPYEREKSIQVVYKGEPLGEPYRADFVCYGKVIVELKAVSEILGVHRAQVIHYLKATKMKLGFLVNFGEESLNIERIVRY
ncbi:GxxExxY protein [uncultured Prevotella sp.]|uniref:GxxExxY protein n=1 Tax=uncultured Prevotella sp. TaxID=159272 RepID=UPI00266C11DF|nr:GxxExxY protein [uncultured Prevotella sp.]